MISCGSIKEVPVQYIDRIEYRDSLIYIHDSVVVEVPVEIVKEVVPELDTSYLKTSIAESVAYLDTTKRQLHHTLEQKGERVNKSDVANSFQHSAIDVLIEKALMAIDKTGYKTLCISGGVGANGYFRDALQKATQNKGIKLVLPEKRYCTDNAAMIGAEGFLQYKRRNFADLTLNAKAVVPLK
jgi:N6-L-threonylcarbamoyladenine synthase